MNKITKILLLLIVIFGLGIPCASAATLYLNPQTVKLRPDSSQDVQIVMDSVPMGLSGFKITLSVLDPTIAQSRKKDRYSGSKHTASKDK